MTKFKSVFISTLIYISICTTIYIMFGVMGWFVTLGETGFNHATWEEPVRFVYVCICFVIMPFILM